jgi:hypothetical protein
MGSSSSKSGLAPGLTQPKTFMESASDSVSNALTGVKDAVSTNVVQPLASATSSAADSMGARPLVTGDSGPTPMLGGRHRKHKKTNRKRRRTTRKH